MPTTKDTDTAGRDDRVVEAGEGGVGRLARAVPAGPPVLPAFPAAVPQPVPGGRGERDKRERAAKQAGRDHPPGCKGRPGPVGEHACCGGKDRLGLSSRAKAGKRWHSQSR